MGGLAENGASWSGQRETKQVPSVQGWTLAARGWRSGACARMENGIVGEPGLVAPDSGESQEARGGRTRGQGHTGSGKGGQAW